MSTSASRKCKECGKTKFVDQFPKAPYKGQRERCNWCTSGYLRRFHEANKARR